MSEPRNQHRISDPFPLLAGSGEMGERTRAFGWSNTVLGPIENWPQHLRIAVQIMLNSRYAMWLGWGPEFIFFYNDAYARMTLGPKHPWALGRPARDVWPEIWHDIGPRAESVVRTGQATWDEGLLLILERRGFPEETYHTFSYSPIPDDNGGIGGMLCVVAEDTERTIGERRLRTLRELAARATEAAKWAEEACAIAALTLAENKYDLPFILIYLLDADVARLAGAAGLPEGSSAAPRRVNVAAANPHDTGWPLIAVFNSGRAELVTELVERFGQLPGGAWPEPTRQAVVLPVAKPGQTRLAGFVVAGISPRLEFDDEYGGFLSLLTNQVASAIMNARAYEEEKRRTEALAELDHAKTAFFSNVSHEFRTPLTLMLGPVEDALSETHGKLLPSQRQLLEVAHRNALWLQRLVNALLDFSRIEAGRARASYVPTDIAAFTAELASVFRSACEKAGLRLTVDCPQLSEPVFIDQEMWEKIVLNLISNAFKFTFEGEIVVSVRQTPQSVELRVRDTGTGIPAEEMPRLFERFHRIENAQGRTHEGSGIGLALVHELVKLHGGSIVANSEFGRGTTFIVSIPLGTDHLPREQIGRGRNLPSAAPEANPFAEEALCWLPQFADGHEAVTELRANQEVFAALAPKSPDLNGSRPCVLVADDNADMRQYLVRLLAERYTVEAAPDGAAALAAVRRKVPDLILTDVMMSRLDGFELLREVRGDPRTSGVPVIMLSARAGEDARAEGMEAGADDYLVKPFSARELLACVGAHLQINRLRQESERAIRQSEERFRVLFETMSEGFAIDEIIFDEAGRACDLRYIEVNPAFERHTGLKRELILGRTTLELFPDAEPYWFERYGKVATTGISDHFQAKFGPLERWFEVSAYRVGPKQLATVFFDITEQKRADEALREADRRKDEFLATLAHELRNPLAPIRNGLQIMHLSNGDRERVEQARTMMERQLQHMVHLVDDLLDLSRISRGKIELRKQRVELAKVVQHAVETSRPAIEQAGHNLTIALSTEPIFVDADTTRLSQVFANLLNNAAKYTERGGWIRLTVQRHGGDVAVSVTDNGVGIPSHMLPKVFEMFTQVDRNLERSQGGLGIGLSIVRRLVEMHGGRVEALSEGQGKGSEFVVHLPMAVLVDLQQCHVDDESIVPATRRRILVVDDNEDSAMSLALMLDLMGCETQTALDGLEALDAAARFRPELVLLDIGMPKLNGYDTARRIRQQPWGRNTVLIALTGWGQDEDRRRSQEAGFDSHMTKPVDPAAIRKLLAGIQANTA